MITHLAAALLAVALGLGMAAGAVHLAVDAAEQHSIR
jgi:hypothetical protein